MVSVWIEMQVICIWSI